ncbi:mannonate dehydratase, partial [Oceanispirochaeta sp.]|uniref:mannonate dehydratase n=1 Tax=Oceanispirochaeta sp. TaxID=2035350 RepID=UPI0026324656
MKMSLRWFGKGYDSITLEQIRQIPGVGGIVTTLYDQAPGSDWPVEDIRKIKKDVSDAGLSIYGMESVNISDEIKVAHGDRDRHIENYISTLKKLSNEGINMVCYNFMPVFDWTRSELAKVRPDGSTVLAYDQEKVDKIHPKEMFHRMDGESQGFKMPGWEPERMAKVE